MTVTVSTTKGCEAAVAGVIDRSEESKANAAVLTREILYFRKADLGQIYSIALAPDLSSHELCFSFCATAFIERSSTLLL